MKKKNTLILNTSAIKGGALTILNYYYENSKLDLTTNYLFIVSNVKLPSSSNIKVLNLPWVKKNYLFRLYFEMIYLRKIIKDYSISNIVNLQNISLFNYGIPVSLYIHQSLPFTKLKFNLVTESKYWFYKNIYKYLMFRSFSKVSEIIVQSKWIKNRLVESGVLENKIKVSYPNVSSKVSMVRTNYSESLLKSKSIFFIYPTSSEKYKNYSLIINALKLIDKELYPKFEILLTLSMIDLNKKQSSLIVDFGLPVSLIGTLERNMLLQIMSSCILLFPSKVESYPLPLKEAMNLGIPIIASDLEFSREILDDYDKSLLFDPTSEIELAQIMLNVINQGNKLLL